MSANETNSTIEFSEDIKAYQKESEQTEEIGSILYRNTNPKITFIDKNQTELIIKPYKKLSSDEIKKIVYEN